MERKNLLVCIFSLVACFLFILSCSVNEWGSFKGSIQFNHGQNISVIGKKQSTVELEISRDREFRSNYMSFELDEFSYFWPNLMKKVFPRFSFEQCFVFSSQNNEIPSSKSRRASYFIFKVTFSFSHLACLDQKWKAKAVDELQSNTKKETFDIPKNNLNVKNVRFKILIDKMSSLSASKTQKNR